MHLAQSWGRENDQRKNPIFTLFVLLPKCSYTATSGNSTLSWMVLFSSQVQSFLPSYNLINSLFLPLYSVGNLFCLHQVTLGAWTNSYLYDTWNLISSLLMSWWDNFMLKDKSPIENQAFLLNSYFFFSSFFSPVLQAIILEEEFQWKCDSYGAPKCHALIHLCEGICLGKNRLRYMSLGPVISGLFIKWDRIYNCGDLKSNFLIPTPLADGLMLATEGWRQESYKLAQAH